jgi:hypothetical protein
MKNWLFIFVVPLLYTACVTTAGGVKEDDLIKDPLAALSAMGEFEPLAAGASAYLSIDVAAARPVLNLLPLGNLDQNRYRELLTETAGVVLALYPANSPARFLAAARGSYPNVLTTLSLTASTDWKKSRAWNDAPYWRSDANALSLSMNATLAMVSDAEPFARSTTSVPAGFEAYRKNAIAAGWTDDAGVSINRLFAALEIPIETPAKTAFFRLDKTGEQYGMTIRFETLSEEQAKGLATLFSLAQLFIGGNSEADTPLMALSAVVLANPAVADGVFLTVRTGLMDAPRAALLFTTFSKMVF